MVWQSNTNYPFNDPNNLTSNPGIAFWTNDLNVSANFFNLMSITSLDASNIAVSNVSFTNQPLTCFKENTKILTDKGYIPIQYLRKGDLVKTLNHEFLPIDMIAYSNMHNLASEERIKDQLYRCSQEHYPEIFEDLIITGCHSILVDEFKDRNQLEETQNMLGNICATDNKLRIPACIDTRASVYQNKGKFTIYHIALENPSYYTNYGIYANGLLVESCSKRYLKELSNMTPID